MRNASSCLKYYFDHPTKPLGAKVGQAKLKELERGRESKEIALLDIRRYLLFELGELVLGVLFGDLSFIACSFFPIYTSVILAQKLLRQPQSGRRQHRGNYGGGLHAQDGHGQSDR